METKLYLTPGTWVRVDTLLKKKGEKYYSHIKCELLENGCTTGQFYAIPISYFLMEPKSLVVKNDLMVSYSTHGIPYMNHRFDKNRLLWIKDKIARFMFIHVVDNIIGPSNRDSSKDRHWAVWKYDIETKDEEYTEAIDDYSYSGNELDEMYKATLGGDASNEWNID